MITVLILVLILLMTLLVVRNARKCTNPAVGTSIIAFKPVPIVAGALPIVGHGLAFSRDIIAFMSRCAARYGPVFQIRLFRLNVVVVCDRALVPEFFKSPEERLSLYAVLDRLYFGHGFSEKGPAEFIPRFVAVVKKSIAVRFDEFVPKIKSEAGRMVERLHAKAKCAEATGASAGTPLEVDLTEEMMRFVSNTSAQCFIGLGLPEQVFQTLLEFTLLLNRIIVLTSYFPTGLIKALVGWKVSALRRKIGAYFEPEIESYRQDPGKTDSLVLRAALDYREGEGDEEQQWGLTNTEISELLVCLLYVSTENTALGLSNTLIDLVLHRRKEQGPSPSYWDELRITCGKLLAIGDARGLLDYPLLNACIMESARLNTHIFPVSRKPAQSSLGNGLITVGNYFLDPKRNGIIDSIVFCPPLLQVYGQQTEGTFENPERYNPHRFLAPDGHSHAHRRESFKSTNIMTWGAGLHLCPGKMFALYEIKMALALLVTGFDMELVDPGTAPPRKDYFSPSAFAERKVKLAVRIRDCD